MGDTDVSSALTTGEIMVLELARAHYEHTGSVTYVFHNRLWVRQQLEELAGRKLLTWDYDDQGNFKVTLAGPAVTVPINGMAGADEVANLGHEFAIRRTGL